MEWLYEKLILLFTIENVFIAVGIILSIVLLSWYQNKLAVVIDCLIFICIWVFILFITHSAFKITYFTIGLIIFSFITFIGCKRNIFNNRFEKYISGKGELDDKSKKS